MTATERLAELGITLPTAPKPVAAYVPAVRTGTLLVTAGQVPFVNGAMMPGATGRVPSQVDLETATAAARQCGLNALAVAAGELDGDLDRIVRVVRLGVFVCSDAGFDGQPQVANGASELMVDVFGDAGRHARAAVGSIALPVGACVEVEAMFEIRF